MYEKFLNQFTKALESVTDSKNVWEIFSEFCHLSRMCFQQVILFDEEREQEIIKIQRASKNPNGFAEALSVLVGALENETGDFLGTWAGLNEVLYSKRGQFFTPYHISRFMAKIVISPTEKKSDKPITLNEPACGAGGMVIAMFETLKELRYYPKDFYVIAQDIDSLCVNMTYLQCTLLDIPAVVILGDTLALEAVAQYPTLSFVRNHPFGIR